VSSAPNVDSARRCFWIAPDRKAANFAKSFRAIAQPLPLAWLPFRRAEGDSQRRLVP
jgi:hypothetical protein